MIATRRYTVAALVLLFGVAMVAGLANDDKDVCGDPRPTGDMRNNPAKVIDWLKQRDTTQRINKELDNHPFIRDLENGKLTKDVMQRFVINQAYEMENTMRSLHGAVDLFGTAWPVQEQRDSLNDYVQFQRQLLDDLQVLAKKFNINNIEDLLKHEPDFYAMQFANMLTDTVVHADDVTEILAPCVAIMDHQRMYFKRMKDALTKNQAYKAWNLNGEDMKFFDRMVEMDTSRVIQQMEPILRRAIDRDVTLCQLRRRTEGFQIGRLAFYDGTVGRNPQPKTLSAHGF